MACMGIEEKKMRVVDDIYKQKKTRKKYPPCVSPKTAFEGVRGGESTHKIMYENNSEFYSRDVYKPSVNGNEKTRFHSQIQKWMKKKMKVGTMNFSDKNQKLVIHRKKINEKIITM